MSNRYRRIQWKILIPDNKPLKHLKAAVNPFTGTL